jgi:NAD+ kinase
MASIAFSCHSARQQALDLAKEATEWLSEAGHEAVLLPEGQGEAQRADEENDVPLAKVDLVVSLGGDGTMLRSVNMVLGLGIPVLGVNFGRFGYLTSVEPDGLKGAIRRFLDGDYSLDRRMTVDVSAVPGPGQPARLTASGLNDVVLARPSGTHTISTAVAISGQNFLSYAADAMILSTPTGSTGYNLSARGPILSPGLRCLVLTPVAAHMLFDHSVVLDPADEVVIRVGGRCDADLIVDGIPLGQVAVGESLVCRAGANDAMLVNFGDRKFETVLKNKFHLTDR